jgi:hypothetical protein
MIFKVKIGMVFIWITQQSCKHAKHITQKWSHWPKITNDTCYAMSRKICQKVAKEDQNQYYEKGNNV